MTTMTSVVAVGFLLGMRHATDADHVIDVATIVNRERSVTQGDGTAELWVRSVSRIPDRCVDGLFAGVPQWILY